MVVRQRKGVEQIDEKNLIVNEAAGDKWVLEI
jgi:hypothetical protein